MSNANMTCAACGALEHERSGSFFEHIGLREPCWICYRCDGEDEDDVFDMICDRDMVTRTQ